MTRKGALSLTRIVPWAHHFLAEILAPGDLAIDLTAGNGQDTLFLWRRVGAAGRVIAFDIQDHALEKAAARLRAAGASVRIHIHPANSAEPIQSPGVHLIRDSHCRLADYPLHMVKAIIGNLGYLPGGDPQVITRPQSTLGALNAGFSLLAAGGRLALVAYPGHAGGGEEVRAMSNRFRGLDAERWDVLHLEAANRPSAPALWVAQKKAE